MRDSFDLLVESVLDVALEERRDEAAITIRDLIYKYTPNRSGTSPSEGAKALDVTAGETARAIVDEHLDEMMSPREYATTRQGLITSITAAMAEFGSSAEKESATELRGRLALNQIVEALRIRKELDPDAPDTIVL